MVPTKKQDSPPTGSNASACYGLRMSVTANTGANPSAAFLSAFRKALASRGLRFTRQRKAVARALTIGNNHQTLDQLLASAKQHYPALGYATVYRTMKLMVDCGLASEHKFAEGQVCYEVADDSHHDHMICVECGAIVEFEDDAIERIQDQLAKRMGYQVVSHRHEIYVRCIDTAQCELRNPTNRETQ